MTDNDKIVGLYGTDHWRELRLRELREQRSRELQFRISLAVLFAWILLGVVDKAMGWGYLSVV